MNKAVIVLCLLLFFTGCETWDYGEPESLTHSFEEKGLILQSSIKIAKDIKVEASLTNTSEEDIIYNGRCGIPFNIFVKKEDATAALTSGYNLISTGCDDVFDPEDL
ncbi:hypothetical protein V1502_10575 [Bacillus sp. SCS-153A]|uniref:hypothetical protein n=1 Tax=Rossellomorea sedimentorum TaxID=3115294 RepID=UPI003906375D